MGGAIWDLVPKGHGNSEQSSKSLSAGGCSAERRPEDRQSSQAQCTWRCSHVGHLGVAPGGKQACAYSGGFEGANGCER